MPVLVATVRAQPEPAFDAVSIKRSVDGYGGTTAGAQGGGRFALTNGRVRELITNAYGRLSFEVTGGPGWISSERYDVIATAGQRPPGPRRRAP